MARESVLGPSFSTSASANATARCMGPSGLLMECSTIFSRVASVGIASASAGSSNYHRQQQRC